jgi:hypothetical protein
VEDRDQLLPLSSKFIKGILLLLDLDLRLPSSLLRHSRVKRCLFMFSLKLLKLNLGIPPLDLLGVPPLVLIVQLLGEVSIILFDISVLLLSRLSV